jgi:hypothetical protein
VIAHDEVFPPDAEDAVWLAEAGRRRWIVLTKDERIRWKPGEQSAIVKWGVRCFVLHPSRGLTGDDMAEILVRVLPRIIKHAEAERAGFVKTVSRQGRIRHVHP